MPEVDAFFKYLITLSLSENHRLFRFIVVDLARPRQQPSINEHSESPEKSLDQKYKELLDPLFRQRRFVMYDSGLAQFMTGPACMQLDRGSMVQSVFGYS